MAIMLLSSGFHFLLLRWELGGGLFVHHFKILLELLISFPFASYLRAMSLGDKRKKKKRSL